MTGSVHLVVPCYRESGRIGDFLPSLCETLDTMGGCHVMVVEDGSGSAEQRRMSDLVAGVKKSAACLGDPLLLAENRGKGGAVIAGWEKNGGEDWLAFVDADGSISAGEVRRLIELARMRSPQGGAIFASRVLMLGRTVKRHLHRHLIGRAYATLVSETLRIPVYDSQCGFKLVPRAAFLRVRPLLTITGFAFDVQLLAALLDSGCTVTEEPVDWHEVNGGKTRIIRDSLRMFVEVMRIRSERASNEWRRTTCLRESL
jgi:glycosyltransferase involved in cell wall biosynthesis